MTKKTICLKGINKKAMRKLVKVTKKLGKMKGIKMTRCSKRRIKKWTRRRRKKKRRKSRKRNKRGGSCNSENSSSVFKHAMKIADFFKKKNQIALGELETKFNKGYILDRGKKIYEDFGDFFDEVDIEEIYEAAMSKLIGKDQKKEMSESSALAFMVSHSPELTYDMLLKKLKKWKVEKKKKLKGPASLCLAGFTNQMDQITNEPTNLLRSYAAYQLLLSYDNSVFGNAQKSWWAGDYQEDEDEDEEEDEDDYDN